MPIVSELQRDRVALLLTLNVLVFVGYAVAVVMLVAVPSVWLVTFLMVGLAYNVIELWQSSPYKQPPDAVGDRARSDTKPAPAVAPPRLGHTHRTDPVLGTQGIVIGRESLSQRLAGLQASIPLPTAGNIEPTIQSSEASMPMRTTTEADAVLTELPAEMLTNTGSELVEVIADSKTSMGAPADAEAAAIIMTSVVAANDPQVADMPEAELPMPQTMDEAAPHAELVSAESEVPTPNIVQIIEPVLESVAEEASPTEPLLLQVDDALTTTPAAATVSEDRVEDAAQHTVEADPVFAVASAAIPLITHVAGRRRDVVDIVIASLVSEAKRAQPATKPVTDEQSALAAKVRTPSESLAMLRNELARTRGSAGSGAPAKPPVRPHKPLGAARKPGKSPADGTRDRVMFVWHGRHFLAPIEGRHPLRVAQSLYDFMVEEAMEHG